MIELFQSLKTALRNDFGASMFLLVVGTIAFVFIGYLTYDYLRNLAVMLRIKRRHRQERRQHRHT